MSKQKKDLKQRHHIIPRSIGGTDEKSNLVYLSPTEHCEAHRELVLKCPETEILKKYKLCLAFIGCLNSNKYIIPEYYEFYKPFAVNLKKHLWSQLHVAPLELNPLKHVWLYGVDHVIEDKISILNQVADKNSFLSLRLLIGKYNFVLYKKLLLSKFTNEVVIRDYAPTQFIEVKIKHLLILWQDNLIK